MGSVERVAKYLEDAQSLTSAKPPNPSKIKSETYKLQTWLRKHQDESLPDGSKQQLLSAIQLYYKLALVVRSHQLPCQEPRRRLLHVCSRTLPKSLYHIEPEQVEPELQESAFALVDDLLKLPEGKLVTSKAKKTCLKWLDELTGEAAAAAGGQSVDSDVRILTVIEIDDTGIITLMHDASGDTNEGELTDGTLNLFSTIKAAFDAGDDVQVKARPIAGNKFQILSVHS